jgi:hypothetical protein
MNAPATRTSLRRRLAVLLVFAVGVVAVAATASTPPPQADLGSTAGTIHLDAAHPMALVRIVVRFDAVATDGAETVVRFRRDAIERGAQGGPAASPAQVGDPVRVVAMEARPEAPASSTFAPPAAGWQAELAPGVETSYSAACGAGPCERALWLVAQLVEASTGPADVGWTVGATSTYTRGGRDYPSGASATFTVDPQIALSGSPPVLAAMTPPEQLTLSADAPAAARAVEVTVGAGAVGPSGASVRVGVQFDGPAGYVNLISVGPGPTPGASPVPAPRDAATHLPATESAFADCIPGRDCTRQFLVTFTPGAFDATPVATSWRLAVRRLDVAAIWASPASLDVRTVRRYDVDRTAPTASLHEAAETGAGAAFVSTTTSSTDPLVRLLPVPAMMTLTAGIAGAPAPSSDHGWHLDLSFRSGPPNSWLATTTEAGATWTGNPLVTDGDACLIGTACTPIAFAAQPVWWGSQSAPPTTPAVHWALDLHVFSYAGVPMTAQISSTGP